MKKLLIAFLSALLLFVSCAKVEDMTDRMSSQDSKIAFTVDNRVNTKAIVEGTTMVDTMGIYGYVVPGSYSNGGYLMKNAQYDEKGDAIGGSYYWPKSDNPNGIDFIFTAYSQYVSAPTWDNDTLKLVVPTLTQSLIDNEDDFDDVLWAQTKYNHHQDGNVGAEHERVELNFKHALSWLQFRGEVINPNIKWVNVKQISFGEYRDSVAGVAPIPEVPYHPAVYDTTDTWVNLKRANNTAGSATKTRVKTGDTWGSYTNALEIPSELIAHIKSYYAVDGRDPGDYSLNQSGSKNNGYINWLWDPDNGNSELVKKLRIVKDIPDEYKLPVEMYTSGIAMVFFDGFKYLKDNGYDMAPATSGGKDAVFGYILLDAFVNGQAYTVVGLNFGDNDSVPQYTVEEVSPEVPYQPAVPGVDPVPACGSVGLYVDGTLCLPTKDTLTTTPLAIYGTQKDTTLNYVKAQVDTIFTNDHIILGNSLVVPQPVPEKITIVFDICISNPGGEDVVFTDRKITRTINTGKDADKDADYVASWGASNKYIYNFRFDGDVLDFTTSVLGWTLRGTDYHVWDY